MNILHLSDIHFGRNKYGIKENFEKKDDILNNLIESIVRLDEYMKPDIVLVTGDIAWQGKAIEYEEAYLWFKKLMEKLNLRGDQIVFCPGNHDVNRSTAVDFTEEQLLDNSSKPKLSIEKCDEYYKFDAAHLLEPRFRNYNTFCERIGMQPYSYQLENGEVEYSYLIGNSEFYFGNRKYSISCFNTAYLPYGKVLKDDQMFLGLPQIKALRNDGKLRNQYKGETNETYYIALFHHADRFLHPNEQCEYDNRPASLSLLLQSVDLAICGHTETGGMPVVRNYRDGGSLLTGGAVYYNDEHPNSFSLININEKKEASICSFCYNDEEWTPFNDLRSYDWKREDEEIKWDDDIKRYPQFMFATQIDGNMKVSYCGRFKIEPIEKDGKVTFEVTNKINPAREFDIGLFDITQQDGTQKNGFIVKLPQTENRDVRAKENLTAYNEFIIDNIQDAAEGITGLLDSSMNWKYAQVLDVPMMREVNAGKTTNHKWYKRLREIEEFYDVRFLHPSEGPTEREQEVIRLLDDLRENGNVIIETPNVQDAFFVVHNIDEMIWTMDVAKENGTINFHYVRDMIIRVFGVEIKLGECDIYLKGFKIKDMDDVNHKLNTWREGDVRKINVVGADNSEWYMSPREYRNEENAKRISNEFYLTFPKEAPVIVCDCFSEYIMETK